jgi:hypothetical protein
MKIFQFFINPNLREDFVFDCFCFEPKNVYERRSGSLYIVGNVKAPSLKNSQFLKKTANFIKENFYKKVALGPEKALRETLKETNGFLEEEIKKENHLWLGGIRIAVLNLKNLKLNFAKAGKVKIQLIRGGKTYNLEKKLKTKESKVFSPKIFGKVASGKLLVDDLILVENEEVFTFLNKEGFFKIFEKEFPFDEKKVKKLLVEKREKLNKISGVLFVIFLEKEREEEIKKERVQTKQREFSIKKEIKPFLLKLDKFKKGIKSEFEILLSEKKWRLILIFILILLVGFLIFRLE